MQIYEKNTRNKIFQFHFASKTFHFTNISSLKVVRKQAKKFQYATLQFASHLSNYNL